MSYKLKTLAGIDPARVPLPVGTEVKTRATAMNGERAVPMGAVGRVRENRGDRVLVDLVGVGEVWIPRSDVLLRSAGQLRFALTRESLWRALEPTIIIETTVGSRAWGLAGEGSDTDRRGVFALPFLWTVGLADRPGELLSADGSSTYWEVGKAITQALRADPNTLEMLHVPGAEARDDIGQWLLDGKDAFVSSAIYGSFGRYALGQLARLRQSLRLAEHRGLLLEWLRAEPTLDLDRAAARLAQTAEIEATSSATAVLRAKEYIKQLYTSLYDRGLLHTRDFVGLVDFAQSKKDDALETPRTLSPKNAYNLLRLIDCATGWLRTGQPRFEVAEPLAGELRTIKRGEVPLGEVIRRADELALDLEEARRATVLPDKPDAIAIDSLLRRIRSEIARRHVTTEPGPWGADQVERPAIIIS